MNDLKIWENPEFGELRVIELDGEQWLAGIDVARSLGYQNGSRDINRHVDDDDRRKIMLFDGNQNKETIVINESGLYSLVLSSKLPSAKRYRRWVTSEVLPSIYRKGGYIVGQERMSDQELLEKALLVAQRNIDERNAQIAKLAPAAEYAQNFLLASGGRLISSIAKDYGMSAQKFNQLLHKLGIQYRQGGQWLLYQKYTGKGYTETKVNLIPHNDGITHQHPETLWTTRGCAFLAKQLASVGVVPEKKGTES